MLSIYFCEDNKEQLELFCGYARQEIEDKQYDIAEPVMTNTPDELLKSIKTNVDRDMGLYFLDISLEKEGMDGFRLSQEIRKLDPRGFIVFITAHADWSTLVFEYGIEVIDYIVKSEPQMIQPRMANCIEKAYERYMATEGVRVNNVILQSGSSDVIVDANKIIYISSSSKIHKINIYTTDEVINIYGSLASVIKRLPNCFYRCHKSYIININQVRRFNKTDRQVILTSEYVCPISLQYTNGLKKKLEKRYKG